MASRVPFILFSACMGAPTIQVKILVHFSSVRNRLALAQIQCGYYLRAPCMLASLNKNEIATARNSPTPLDYTIYYYRWKFDSNYMNCCLISSSRISPPGLLIGMAIYGSYTARVVMTSTSIRIVRWRKWQPCTAPPQFETTTYRDRGPW